MQVDSRRLAYNLWYLSDNLLAVVVLNRLIKNVIREATDAETGSPVDKLSIKLPKWLSFLPVITHLFAVVYEVFYTDDLQHGAFDFEIFYTNLLI